MTKLHLNSCLPQCLLHSVALFVSTCVLVVLNASAIGEVPHVQTAPGPGRFPIVADGAPARIWVDAGDHPGVIRAVRDLGADIKRVTDRSPLIVHDAQDLAPATIVVGTIGRSALIDRLVEEKRLDVSGVAGQWESFVVQVIQSPLTGTPVETALVIAGSDMRGTIYGIYGLSEQIGVSPWYWWADVPVVRRPALFVEPGRYVEGPPAVRYRGIFLNDEAPALTGWANEKFGGYNHRFYTNVFELLLRMKANFLWPAMWNNSFNSDDVLNPKLADEYGIVMSTSHHEPMMRAWKEWERAGNGRGSWDYSRNPEKLRAFWEEGIRRTRDYEKIVTLAMRGDGDEPMSREASVALLETIVADQRQIIADVMQTNVHTVPQVWALYKEVQEYYEKGMRVPDDVTLLWCDDNWGNVRRLPTPEERRRSGGAGIYYHFDYVGGPRNYKWLNTVPIAKIWEQMNLAYQYEANRIWVVNVGDLKPMEIPIEFFLSLAWKPERWPKEKLSEYTRLWAAREFGSDHAAEIADIVSKYTKYNGRRKPELLEPGTFSLTHYQEADRVVAEWKDLVDRAERIQRQLPANARDAFFQLVLHPAKACAIVNELYVSAARNRLYASQGRASANDFATRTRELFQADADLTHYYNRVMAGGKWNHMMDQTHIGYTYWQQPPSNVMPRITEIELPSEARLGIALEGFDTTWPGASGEPVLPQFDKFNQPRRFIDVFNRGQAPFEFTVETSAPWIVVSATNGAVAKETRLWVEVDWPRAPSGSTEGVVRISGARAEPVPVGVRLLNPPEPTRENLKGFVEADGYVSIEAVHYTQKIDAGTARWEKIDDLGRTLSSMSVFPVTAPSATPPRNSPRLEYEMYLFHPGAVEVETIIAPGLNIVPNRGLRLAISFDDEPPQVLTAVPVGYFVDNGNRDWEESVKDNARKIRSTHTLDRPGYHTLKVWMVDPGVSLQKLVVNTGGVLPCYLGPPESYRAGMAGNP